jgi:diacylglycerol kinase
MIHYIKRRLASFGWAIKGIIDLIRNHPNAQIHVLATCIVLPLGFYFNLLPLEWGLIILCIALVLALEAVNSAIEYLADKISPEQDPLIGKAKDIAAGAVLIAAIGAAIIGSLIFIPKLIALW